MIKKLQIVPFFDCDFFRKKRAKSTADKISNLITPTSAILNVGSGKGFLEEFLLEKHPNLQITSVDQVPPKNKKTEFLQGDFQDLEFQNKSFDLIIFSLSLHHIKDPALALKKAHRLLKQNSGLFIFEIAPPNNFFKRVFFDSRVLCINRVHTWTKKHLEKLVTKEGFALHSSTSENFALVNIYAKKA